MCVSIDSCSDWPACGPNAAMELKTSRRMNVQHLSTLNHRTIRMTTLIFFHYVGGSPRTTAASDFGTGDISAIGLGDADT